MNPISVPGTQHPGNKVGIDQEWEALMALKNRKRTETSSYIPPRHNPQRTAFGNCSRRQSPFKAIEENA